LKINANSIILPAPPYERTAVSTKSNELLWGPPQRMGANLKKANDVLRATLCKKNPINFQGVPLAK
jgi:hypothetical protein